MRNKLCALYGPSDYSSSVEAKRPVCASTQQKSTNVSSGYLLQFRSADGRYSTKPRKPPDPCSAQAH